MENMDGVGENLPKRAHRQPAVKAKDLSAAPGENHSSRQKAKKVAATVATIVAVNPIWMNSQLPG
jgi:hypothetical protein